jgi:hypothetical protein
MPERDQSGMSSVDQTKTAEVPGALMSAVKVTWRATSSAFGDGYIAAA